MSDRELTQLISAAKEYLDAADALQVPNDQLATTVSSNSARWPTDRKPHALPPLDKYSAHLASSAARLATIHEILRGDTEKAWAEAYPDKATQSVANIASGKANGLEILVRDYFAHAETPLKNAKRSEFRKAALETMTFKKLGDQLRTRFQELAAELDQGLNA